MDEPEPITFTELLYSVVIGTAITRIDSLVVSQSNVLLLVALLIVFDDYFLYHHEVVDIEYSGKNAIGLFWLDMLVLLVWYAVSISTQYSVAAFFMCVATFFLSTSIWELIFSKEPIWKRIAWDSDIVVVCASITLSVSSHYNTSPNASYLLYAIVFLVFFSAWRSWSYKEIWSTKA